MIKFGQVIERNDRKGLVTIRFERPEACGKCNACAAGSQKGEVTLQSGCKVGEWARVELPESRFLQATALVYVIPLCGLVGGILLGWLLGSGNDLWTVLGALFGLLLSLLILFGVDRRVSRKSEWIPKITAVYQDKPTSEDMGCVME